ncbi:MAG: VCBS repeat-containing protein [Cyclobacteriaceae bacterium]|nr:VCBS repeat-containing protein [Cyclobacteriaceae bacterium]
MKAGYIHSPIHIYERMIQMKTSVFLRLLLLACMSVFYSSSHAQKPSPPTLDKVSGSTAEVVTIQGSGFSSDLTKLAVFFGGVKGDIQVSTDQIIEVRIPAGTTFDNVSVTNLVSGLTGYSRQHFWISFGGNQSFDPNNLVGQTDFNAGSGLYDQCLCDFDGDKRVDIATANDNATLISLLANTSTGPGNINFAVSSIAVTTRTIHIRCGDLNGDGKPDIVASEGGTGNRIFILKNNSSGTGNFTFGAPQVITLTGKKVKQLQIADLDLDGKPEVIVTDQGGNGISVLVNSSSLASISFLPVPVNITITGAVSTDGLQVEDLNGDDRPEIITSQFLTSGSNVYIHENKSTPGNFSFTATPTLTLGGTVVNLKVGDLDGDRKPDIAASQLLASGISIFLNQSTSTAISFASPKSILTEERPWGLDVGDLDGDGKPDVVVASISKKSLTILNNTSTIGNLTFDRHIKATTFINRHINIGDLDSDGKPDIAFTSIDDNNNSILASKVSVFRNKACMIPEITPSGPITICAGFPLRLFATVSGGTTYDWKLNGVTQVSGPNAFFDVTATGNYTVTAIAEGGTCSQISNSVTVNVGAGTASGIAVATNDGPACAGNTLNLSVNNVGATQYKWTGPAGYTSTGLTPAPITNFKPENAGRYYVDIIVGTCIAQRVSTLVEIIDIPDFQVGFTGANVICQGDNKTLSVLPNTSGFSYQWYKDGSIITGSTSQTYVASTTGEYTAKVKLTLSAGCPEVQTAPVKLGVVALPVAAFTSPATACAGEKITFTNQSTSDASATATYAWAFGDGNVSTLKEPQHQYNIANTYNIKLTVSYSGSCPVEQTKSITITAAPAVTITNPDNKYKFCAGEDLKLEVLGTFNNYLWSTSASTSSITVQEAGTYSVDVTATNGCVISASRLVETFPAPIIEITATPPQINEGESSQLAASGLLNYSWTPDETLSAPATATPLATPITTTVYTVSGTDNNGCLGEKTVEVRVVGEATVGKLNPGFFFSPNEDPMNPYWVVEKIDEYPKCGVTIYDDKGIKVFSAKPYLNNWDGTFKGKRLPDGVYYFIIRCDGEENKPRTGSITILR